MKIAVTYENKNVFQHFGHTEYFKIYTVENQKVTSSEVISAKGSGHGALAGFLKDNGVNELICGGIGAGAKTALTEAGIKLFGGVTGDTDEIIDNYLNGILNYNTYTLCNHHDSDHKHENCGNHH